jgi:hypothetical protein
MRGRDVKSALDHGVRSVDIVVRSPGVARLTRLSRPADVDAALQLLRGLAEGDAGGAGGGAAEHPDNGTPPRAPKASAPG